MHYLKQKIILLALVLSVVFTFAPVQGSAAGLVPCGGYSTDSQRPCNVLDIFTMVAKVTNFLIALAGVYAAYQIISNAFWMVLSAGNEENIAKTKAGVSNAVVGFVLVLMAYVIVNTATNILLTRALVTKDNPECRLNFQKPETYLKINEAVCTKK